MIPALFNQPNYAATKKMLDATALRHEAIASNLANLETPRYKRLDIAPTFQDALRLAAKSGDANQIATLNPSLAVDAQATASGRDGNTVQLENELLLLSQNTLAHALETHLVTGNLQRLRTAITGRLS